MRGGIELFVSAFAIRNDYESFFCQGLVGFCCVFAFGGGVSIFSLCYRVLYVP